MRRDACVVRCGEPGQTKGSSVPLYPSIPLVGIFALQPWLRIGMQDGHEDRRVDEPGLPSETRHHLGSWLRALAGLCLAAAVAGGAVILAGGSTAGADAHIADPSQDPLARR